MDPYMENISQICKETQYTQSQKKRTVESCVSFGEEWR